MFNSNQSQFINAHNWSRFIVLLLFLCSISLGKSVDNSNDYIDYDNLLNDVFSSFSSSEHDFFTLKKPSGIVKRTNYKVVNLKEFGKDKKNKIPINYKLAHLYLQHSKNDQLKRILIKELKQILQQYQDDIESYRNLQRIIFSYGRKREFNF